MTGLSPTVIGGFSAEELNADPGKLLQVSELTTRFFLPSGPVRAVEKVSLEVNSGETLGIVGESGSGKTATAMSILRLLPRTARVMHGSVHLRGTPLLSLSEDEMRSIRGKRIALVPQNPLSALNPVLTVGWQLREAISAHASSTRSESEDRIVEALDATGLPAPARQLGRYPHELSGGMRQRVLIAMAIVNHPELLVADEPTTALDSTTQAQILDVLKELIRSHELGVLLITHNMGVVASLADRVAVMYDGEIVEVAPVDEIFREPKHPYTQLLVASTPGLRARRSRGQSVGIQSGRKLEGCHFRARCPIAVDTCSEHPSLLPIATGHLVRCWVAQADVQMTGSNLQTPKQ